jgi:hypothetical protein
MTGTRGGGPIGEDHQHQVVFETDHVRVIDARP